MRYDIKRGAETIASQFFLEGTVTERIMGEESVNVTFSHPSKIEFHIGDKITIYGKDYFLSADPSTVKKNSREFQYTMIFFSIKYSLSNWNVFFYDNDGLLTIPEFSIMGTASTCLDIVITNANRADSGWAKGVVDDTEVKNINFSDCNCLEAISKIAEEFKLEYWIDSNKSIHFTERKPVSGYSFEYGKAKGLKDITRSVLEGGTLVTRLYVKGSDKNLPKNYRGGQKNLRIDVPCLEKNIDIYGVKEHTETFSDIYPKRVGTVTAVDPLDPNRFTDADLDFDLNAYNEYGTTVLMNGVAAKIIFQTGQLAGYRIELIEAGGFNSATKTFYLNPVKDEKDMQVPSELLRPAVGDTYIIEDIMMPEAYVLLAESDVKIKGQEYLDQNSKERFQYASESDILYFKNQNINIQLGYTVHFKDEDFNLDDDIRITGLQKNIQNPYDVKFDLSEVTVVSSIVQSYYEQQEQTNAILNSIKYNAELARRNYLFGREFHDKVFDGEDYFNAENIKPLSIETKMLSLGSRLQQFGLPGVNFKLQNNNALQNTAGKIAHQTIDPNAIREWNIAANTVIGITNNFNYIYIKCQKIGTNANFVITEAQIKVEQDPDFYHFEVGYLSSVIDGYRKIKTTYGFAQLNPAELSIGRISDPTGNNYIDLLPDRIAIKAKVEFTSDSPAFEQVNNAIAIGGRNYLRNSGNFKNKDFWGVYGTATTIQHTGNVLRVIGDVTGLPRVFNSKYIKIDTKSQDWIFSLEYNSNNFISGLGGKFGATETSGEQGSWEAVLLENINLGNGNRKSTFKWNSPVYSNSTPSFWIYFYLSNNQTVDLKYIKVEKGNKATDWTPAPEDISAQILIVEEEANIASAMLEDIASDSKLTPSEKQLLKKEYDLIIAEKPSLTSQASTYGISTITYTNAYNAVVIYTNPLLVNLTTTSDIVGSVLRTTFNTYYTAKVNLLKAITDKVSQDFSSVYDAIEEAQTTANNAINQIDELGSDSKLTPSEKQVLVNEWNRIKSEYNQNNTVASSLGVPVTVYQSAYNSLNIYISPLLANLTTTTDIVGITFRTNFQNYYNACVAIVTAIGNKQIENIQVGGRNYLRNSGNFTTTEFWNVYASAVRSIENGTLKMIGDATGLPRVFNNKYIKLDTVPQQWIFTVEYNSNNFIQGIGGKFGATDTTGEQGFWDAVLIENINLGSGNRKSTFKWNSPVYSNSTPSFWIYFYLFNNQQVNLKFIKAEKGTKSTDWTPAPEDIDSAIAGANTNSANAVAQATNALNTANKAAAVTNFMQTTVDGNVVSTGTLQVGSVTGANAGITGVVDRGSDSVRFWAGSNFANKEKAAWSVAENGLHSFYHPNGFLGLEIGVKNGEIVINGYHETGFKTYEMSPNRGLVNVAYIPENFSMQKSMYFGATYNENNIKNTLIGMVTNTLIDYGVNSIPGRRYNRQWKLNSNLLGSVSLYSAGTHPANEQYKPLEGYKKYPNDRNQNADNGWYYFNHIEIIASGWDDDGVPEASAFFGMYRLEGGKVVENKTIYTQVYAT
ncbi:MAG: phage tail protein [Flavobacteriales bacterium]|nr:phage tail protein [Flavobacteriales bacterium]